MKQSSLFNYEDTVLMREDIDLVLHYRDMLVIYLLEHYELRRFKRDELMGELLRIQSWITVNNF